MFTLGKSEDALRAEAENAYGLILNIKTLSALNPGDLLFIDNSSMRKPNEKDIGNIGYVSEVHDTTDKRWTAEAIPLYYKPNTCYLILSDGNTIKFSSTFTHCLVYGDSKLFVGEDAINKQLMKYGTSIEEFLKLNSEK